MSNLFCALCLTFNVNFVSSRGVAVGALLTTSFSCLLMFTQMVIDGLQFKIAHNKEPHTFSNFFLAYGTIVFAFGGASTFPTIQNDMVDRSRFPTSVSIGFVSK